MALVAALSTAQASAPWMTGQSRPEDLKITVVTFSPGDELEAWWGHTALIVADTKLDYALLYNFGMFGPVGRQDDLAFIKDFIKGRLIFWVAPTSIMGTFEMYRRFDRDVRLQELDLEPSEAQAIATRLGTHVLPENMMYRYHHYNDNCSTRPRDIIDEAIGGQLKAATAGPSRMTLRDHTLRYSRVSPLMSLVLDYLQADSLDKPIIAQKDAYLPDELERQLNAQHVKRADGSDRPLVKKAWDFYTAKARVKPPEKAPNWLLYELLAGLGLAALAHAFGHFGRDGKKSFRILLGLYTLLLGVLLGIFGSALTFLMLFTDHDVTYWNENIFQANPIHLALVVTGFQLMRGKVTAARNNRWVWSVLGAISALGVLIKVLPMADQNNWNILALTVPVNVGVTLLWWLDRRYQASKNPK